MLDVKIEELTKGSTARLNGYLYTHKVGRGVWALVLIFYFPTDS